MIRTPAGQILFAGDSGAGPHWDAIRTRLGPPDIALLPIGAYEPRWFMAAAHMNPSEAVQAHNALGARRSIGMHFGTFQLTDEPIDAPLEALAAARREADLDPAHFVTHGFGETRIFRLGG
jgi:L-ascorbate metabolism protein UlaG (beta-lactamase superfamily)